MQLKEDVKYTTLRQQSNGEKRRITRFTFIRFLMGNRNIKL